MQKSKREVGPHSLVLELPPFFATLCVQHTSRDECCTQLCPSGLLPSQAVSEDTVSTLTSPVFPKGWCPEDSETHQAERQTSSKPLGRSPAKILFFDKFSHKLNIFILLSSNRRELN